MTVLLGGLGDPTWISRWAVAQLMETNMGRRRNTPARRSVLGSYFNHAVGVVEQINYQTVYAMIKPTFGRMKAIDWLFPKHTRQVLRDAWFLADGHHESLCYDVDGCRPAKVWIRFEDTGMLTPKLDAVDIAPEVQPLFDLAQEIRAIHEDFATLMHVLRWMDEHATVGAMRYYWPCVASLAPNCEATQGVCPVSFQEPQGIHAMIPLLRETSALVAAGKLLPPQVEAPNNGLSINFTKSYNFVRHGLNITTQARDYEI